jgi:stage II sporulation protein D
MKEKALGVAIFALAILLLPMAALNTELPATAEAAQAHQPIAPEAPARAANPEQALIITPPQDAQQEAEAEEQAAQRARASRYGTLEFHILDEGTGEVHAVSVRDYICGAVATEMPASFHAEAIKAQAVAAHTYALYQHNLQQKNADPALRGADFSADPGGRKGYATEAAMKEFYGSEYADYYWNKVCGAVDSVLAYVMEYEEELVLAAYHAISAGKTEAAENVWGSQAAYLRAVESEGDYMAPGFESQVFVPQQSARETFLEKYPEMRLSKSPGDWFEDLQYSDSGYITAARVGGVNMTGSELRSLFELRSHNLEIQTDDAGIHFTAFGYGHGVGLSQYGADYLARQGYTFDQILAHYYSGVSLKVVDFEKLAG